MKLFPCGYQRELTDTFFLKNAAHFKIITEHLV